MTVAALRQRSFSVAAPHQPGFGSCAAVLVGLAVPFGVGSLPDEHGDVVRFAPQAFDQVLAEVQAGARRIYALWAHQPDWLGGTDTGELRLWTDATGLRFALDAGHLGAARLAQAEARLLRCSTGRKRTSEELLEIGPHGRRRVVTRCDLSEVSLTLNPRFPQTHAALSRSPVHEGSAVRHPPMPALRPSEDDEPGVNLLSAYSSILSKLGATPVDESKVAHPEDPDEDPAERFFQ